MPMSYLLRNLVIWIKAWVVTYTFLSESLASMLVLNDVNPHISVHGGSLTVTASFLFFHILRHLYDTVQVEDNHHHEDVEDDDEKEGPHVLHGLVMLNICRGVDISGGHESHDGGPQAEDVHDVEAQPGQQEKVVGPRESNYQEAVAHHLAGQTRHQQIHGGGVWTEWSVADNSINTTTEFKWNNRQQMC